MLHIEARFKKPDYIFDSSAYFLNFRIESTSRWDRDLIDRYLHGECGFQLDITGLCQIGPLNFKEEEWIVTFQKVDPNPFPVANLYSERLNMEFTTDMSGDCCDNMQQPVPVFSGAIMKQEQMLHEVSYSGIGRIRSIVRLYRGNPRNEVWREFPLVDGCFLKPRLRVADGKFEAICFGGRVGLFEEYCGLVDSGVQSSAHVVKELAQLKSETVFSRTLSSDANTSICPFAVWLSHEFVGIWISNSLPFSLKGFEVSYGPVKTLPAFRKELTVHTSS